VAQNLQFCCEKKDTKSLSYILQVFSALSALTPYTHRWLARPATRVLQLPPLHFRDIAILSGLQVCFEALQRKTPSIILQLSLLLSLQRSNGKRSPLAVKDEYFLGIRVGKQPRTAGHWGRATRC